MKKLSIAAALALAFAAPGASAADQISTKLTGWEENPSISTPASGTFSATISNDDSEISYELTFANLLGTVTQAHIHISRPGVNGGISAWLCGTLPNTPGPAGTPPCPVLPAGEVATVTGTITAAQVVGPVTQQILAGELAELIAAIRAGAAYANVHSTVAPGGEMRGQIGANGNSAAASHNH